MLNHLWFGGFLVFHIRESRWAEFQNTKNMFKYIILNHSRVIADLNILNQLNFW